MSLFRYKVLEKGGKETSGLITGKTEASAREKLAKRISIVDWHSIEEVPPGKLASQVPVPTKPKPLPGPKSKPTAASPAPKEKPLSKLSKMLYLQHGRCFFCEEPLKAEDANIEHLNPRSKGGTNTEDNEVACHASLNETFGNMDLKRKFEFVLKSAGNFKCLKR